MTTLVVGAGFAGLGAVSELHRQNACFSVLEAADEPGGLAVTDVLDGFRFDRTGHFLHARTPQFRDLLEVIPVRMNRVTRRSAVIVGPALVPYPIQFNLWALPEQLRRVALDEMQQPRSSPDGDPSFADVVRSTWGEMMTGLFFRPYNEKLWCRPLEALPANCAGRFLPTCDMGLVRAGMLGPVVSAGYNAELLYPVSGRIGEVASVLALHFGADIEYRSAVDAIDVDRRVVVADGRERRFDELVSTVPLPRLLHLCGVTSRAEELELRFEHTDVLNLRVGFRGTVTCREQWLYVPDPRVGFYRVGFPSNVNAGSCPPGCVSLSLEYGLLPGQSQAASTSALADLAVEYLGDLGLIEVEELLVRSALRISPGYVLARPAERARVDALLSDLACLGIHSAGRYGAWDYFSMEDSFLSGVDAAQRALARRPEFEGA